MDAFPNKLKELNVGQPIKVLDHLGQELGRGTFLSSETYQLNGTDMTAYVCKEHTILAKPGHQVKVISSSSL